jgi:MFS family permease
LNPVRRNVLLLSACQALLLMNNVIFISLNGLAGYTLAANKALATLPVTGYLVGGALWAVPASRLMKRYGRRAGFTLGSTMGMIGAAICALAIRLSSFELLCLGTLATGAYNAFGIQYRFAAADAATREFRPKAIALVLAGGIVGGVLGPESAKLTMDLFALPFVGSYLSLIVFALASLAILRFLEIPDEIAHAVTTPPRKLRVLLRQPGLVVAMVAASLSYGIMNLLMTATPLAMGQAQHAFSSVASVIEWHVIGMFAPGFVSGGLIARYGTLRVMLTGVGLLLACVGIALGGQEVMHFWWALTLLGVGWNFVFVGATTLLTQCYQPAEKALVQGANDACVFTTIAVSSFASDLLLHANGWTMLNWISFVPLAVLLVTLSWLAWTRRTRVAVRPA